MKGVVLFDVDGVLVDSLDVHLKICERLSQRFGLSLKIPTPREFQTLAREKRISPMKEFFAAVGFPPDRLEEADKYYQENFSREFSPKPFPDVIPMLKRLHEAGLLLGLATSNVKANVESALGSAWELFSPRYCYTFDDPRKLSKAQALVSTAKELGLAPDQILYIGDQPSDYVAAREAGTQFLGVTWGWAITQGVHDFPTVHDPAEIGDYVMTTLLKR